VPTIEQLRASLIEVMQGQRRHLEGCAARHDLSGQLAIALLQLCSPWPSTGTDAHGGTVSVCPDGGMPMRELAGRISCDPSQVTGIADRLEDLGLVERRPSPQDRRVKLLVVTDEGVLVAGKLAAEVNRDAPGFSALTDQERVELARLLAKVADSS
jgi:DNA-binding MarR family transcriptional regulator